MKRWLEILIMIACALPCKAQLSQIDDYEKKASLALKQEKFDDALMYARLGVSYVKEQYGVKNRHYIRALSNLGELLRMTDRFEDAEKTLNEAAILHASLAGSENMSYAIILNNLGLALKSTGRYDEAIKLFLQSRQIRDELIDGYHPLRATPLNNLGELYREIGDFRQAEKYLFMALEIEESSRIKRSSYSKTLSNIGLLYKSMGNYERAKDFYIRALNEAKRYSPWSSSYAIILSNLATLYMQEGKVKSAEELLVRSDRVILRVYGRAHSQYAKSQKILGDWYISQRKLESAIGYLTTACNIFKRSASRNNISYANALNSLAYTYELNDMFELARTLYLSSLQNYLDCVAPDHILYNVVLRNLAILYKRLGYNDLSALLSQEINKNLLSNVKRQFVSLSSREKYQYYRKHVLLSIQLQHSIIFDTRKDNPSIVADLYNNILLTKGILLKSEIQVQNSVFSSGDSLLISMYRQWRDNVNFLAKVYRMSLDERERSGVDLEKLEDETNSLEKRLSSGSETFSQSIDSSNNWKKIQQKLMENEAAIEITRFRYFDKKWTDKVHYAALVITCDAKYPIFILIPDGNNLEREYATLYNGVAGSRDMGIHAVSNAANSRELYKRFWAPIASHTEMKHIKKIYISGDGIYNQINLNILQNPNTNKYLLDELDIHQMTSTGDLMLKNLALRPTKNAVLVGNPAFNDPLINGNEGIVAGIKSSSEKKSGAIDFSDRERIKELPGTNLEIAGIAKLLKEHNILFDTLTGRSASEKAFKQIRNPKLLHIATHGYFNRDLGEDLEGTEYLGISNSIIAENPLLRSGLLLAGSSGAFSREHNSYLQEDGILTAFEAMSLSLEQTELVVLSACETGLGVIRNGEGVYGLQRAFQKAGVRFILMSLWKVDDDVTQKFMIAFYNNWLAGNDIRSSLRITQKQIRIDFPQPYYWGAFVLVGE